jgi:hypothetical protein
VGERGTFEGQRFISYSRKDTGFADRLEAALKARGFEPVIDRTEIYAFEEWWMRTALQTSMIAGRRTGTAT